MKKSLHFIFLIGIAILTGCSSDQDIFQEEKNSNIDVKNLYDSYIGLTDSLLNDNIKQLDSDYQSRSNNSEYAVEILIDVLSSLPENYVATELSKYNAEEMEECKDNLWLSLRSFFDANCGEEETVRIFEFADVYFDRGGHDISFMAEYISGMSDLGAKCIVFQASMIDQILTSPVTRVIGDPCLDALTRSLYQTLWPQDVVDFLLMVASATPGVDLVAACIEAGYDSYELLKIANDYNHCRLMRV